jgi:hypothetical protein
VELLEENLKLVKKLVVNKHSIKKNKNNEKKSSPTQGSPSAIVNVD